MYYPRWSAKVTQLLPIVVVPNSQYSTDVKEENAADIKIITEGSLISKEREEFLINLLQRKERIVVGLFIGLVMGAQLD
jgi:hypothetical protein